MVITEKDMGEGSRCIDNANSKEESDDDNEQNSDDVELAVDIIESVRLGSGARIPFLLAWCTTTEWEWGTINNNQDRHDVAKPTNSSEQKLETRKRKHKKTGDVLLDAEAWKKARSLVDKAKRLNMKRAKHNDKTNADQKSFPAPTSAPPSLPN
jgi:hypothetical protein